MIKQLLYFMLLVFGWGNAQIVDIPDANFKTKLVSAYEGNGVAIDVNGNSVAIDVNNDGEIQLSEALNIYELKVNHSSIVSLVGIESFANLRKLDCYYNILVNVDISSLTYLEYFDCNNNTSLINLNVAGLANLQHLDCSIAPQLPSLDLTGLNSLTYLNCNYNNFSELSVNHLLELETLECYAGDFTSLDITNLSNLTSLNTGGNENLTTLYLDGLTNLRSIRANSTNLQNVDFSGLINLEFFQCQSCNFEEIDISPLKSLKTLDLNSNYYLNELDCSYNYNLENLIIDGSNLSALNLKNGSSFFLLADIHYDDIPENCYICLDQRDLEGFNDDNLPEGTFYSTYCSYYPGGNFNTISGKLFFDSNNDGICEAEVDFPQNFVKISISNEFEQTETFTDSLGNYAFYTQEGNFQLIPQLVENENVFDISPTNLIVSFPDNQNNNEIINFCVKPNGEFADVKIVISPLEPARPGFPATYKIVYRNIGNQTVSGELSFRHQEEKMDYSSSNPNPDSQTDELLTYNFSDLIPFETREIIVEMDINTPTETPPVNIGDWLSFKAEIEIPNDINLNDNEFTLRQEVVGSFDPNDILCLEGTSVDVNMIGEELHYRIRFENTGTYPAERVVVAMPINPEEYDVSSFQLLNTSHQVQARVVNNTAEFFFQDIQLQPNGQGDILFSIKSLNSLSVGDSVMSYADIYFDYNYPITTNEVETTFEILGLNESNPNVEVAVYPNPVKDILNIQSDSKIKSVELYDLTGKFIKVNLANSSEITQNFSGHPNGIYILKIYTQIGMSTHKIIKQ